MQHQYYRHHHHQPHPSTPTTSSSTSSFLEHQLQAFSATPLHPPATPFHLMPTHSWSAFPIHRKRKQSRYLQHRRWPGSQRQPLCSPLPLQSAASASSPSSQQQQQLATTLLNAEQQHFVQLPLGLLEQPIGDEQQQQRGQQALCQYSLVQVEDLGADWQGHYQHHHQQQQHSFLLPIDEEEEDRWWLQQQQQPQWNNIEENGEHFQLEFSKSSSGAITTTSTANLQQISTQSSSGLQSQHSHRQRRQLQHPQSIFSNQNNHFHSPHNNDNSNNNNNHTEANSPKAFAGNSKHHHHQHIKQQQQQPKRSRAGTVQAIRKSRSESFLAYATRYRRLNDCSAEDEEGEERVDEEEAALTEPNDSEAESEDGGGNKVGGKSSSTGRLKGSSRQAVSSSGTLSARIRQSSSSLGRLAYSTITESFKMFRSLKLHWNSSTGLSTTTTATGQLTRSLPQISVLSFLRFMAANDWSIISTRNGHISIYQWQ